nr:MAG TPA: hypothetical protein [Caudoviricetes sp.]
MEASCLRLPKIRGFAPEPQFFPQIFSVTIRCLPGLP